jgi:hypothetical protein
VKPQVVFGRREAFARPDRASISSEAANGSLEPSGSYAEIAEAARVAFRTPLSALDLPEAEAPAKPIDDDEGMRAFVGPNWQAYRGLWRAMREAPGLRASYGVAPAMLGGVWLVFRKRYLLGFGALGIEGGLVALAPLWAPFAALLLRFLISRYGKSIVLTAGAAAIAGIAPQESSQSAALYRLSREGGVSWLMASVAWFAAAAAFGIVAQQSLDIVSSAPDATSLLVGLRGVLP